MKNSVLVVLSGGQDSATCLFHAVAQGRPVHAITFDYGQRHRRELICARDIGKMAGVLSHEFVQLPKDILRSTSPLVSENRLEQYADHDSLPGGLEKTFVPMRNQLFLTIAANRLYALGGHILLTGVCQEDSGGYPDCTQKFIRSFEDTTALGTFTGIDDAPGEFNVWTPLMHQTKAQTCHMAWNTPKAYTALAFTQTGYDGAYPPNGKDHATLLRAKGFYEAGLPDPLVLRCWSTGLMDLPATSNYSSELVEAGLAVMHQDCKLYGWIL